MLAQGQAAFQIVPQISVLVEQMQRNQHRRHQTRNAQNNLPDLRGVRLRGQVAQIRHAEPQHGGNQHRPEIEENGAVVFA